MTDKPVCIYCGEPLPKPPIWGCDDGGYCSPVCASKAICIDDTVPDSMYERDGKWFPRVPDTDPAAKPPRKD